MNDPHPAGPRSGPAGAPTSRLSAATLRISQSLDLATVLEEAVESARALTGARVGVMTTFDERGRVRDFLISGLPPEERRKMVEWPDGPRLFEHLRDLPAPLRVADVPGYLGSLGLSVSPWGSRTLQGTPMHHRGEHLGNFSLGDKEDGEAFTVEDEEILVLFASQAASLTPEPAARCRRTERWSRSSNAPGPRRPNAAASSPRRPLGSGPRCRRSANGS